jgi:trimethylamine--corrinoid protein Co-methyltransferase
LTYSQEKLNMREMHDQRAAIQPIKSKWKLSILEESDLRAIDESALIILEEVGVHMPLERALRIYADTGAKVDFSNQIVRIPHDLVKNNMAKAPRHYVLAGRDRPELDVHLDGKSGTYFNNGGTAANTIDFISHQKRRSCKDDVAKMARIVDYLSIISICWPIVSAADHLKSAMLHELDVCFNNTEKHVQTETVMGEMETKYAIEMASIIAGGRDRLRDRPVLSALICGVAPLGHDKGGLEAALGFAEAGVPIGYMSMPVMGTTAPASQAGTLACGLAEVLSGLVLVQLAHPGSPCYLSIIPAVIDPRSGDYVYSATSAQLANAASIQLAHYYGVPAFSGSSFGGSSYELNRWQVGKENVYLPLLEVMLGADMCFSMGIIGDDNLFHPARVIFDREVFQAVRTISQGIEVTKGTLLLDSVRRVGPRGHFLLENYTVENLLKLWSPSILFQKPTETAARYEDPARLAWEEINWIMEHHQVPELESSVRNELTRIIQAAEGEMGIL